MAEMRGYLTKVMASATLFWREAAYSITEHCYTITPRIAALDGTNTRKTENMEDTTHQIDLNTQQIGKLGELLVQYQLLQHGVESAHLTTDAGIDLVAYSGKVHAKTIQVKANFQPKPSGGKGSFGLDWWFPVDSPAELIALVDISENRVWMFTLPQAAEFAQQTSNGRHHMYMYIDATARSTTGKPSHTYKFDDFLLQNCIGNHF